MLPNNPDQLALLQKFVELEKHRDELEASLKQVKEELANIHDGVLAVLESVGCSLMRMDGLTIYVDRRLFAGPEHDHDVLVAALAAKSDTAFLVKPNYHWKQLTSWVDEFERDEDGMPILPESLRGVLKVSEVTTVRTRRS